MSSTNKKGSTLKSEFRRIRGLFPGLTFSWTIYQINPDTLDEIEKGGRENDSVLKVATDDLLKFFSKIQQPTDFIQIAQAYEAYAEASAYIFLKGKGLDLKRTPGTGKEKQKRPDFEFSAEKGNIYFEIKSLDFQDGKIRHKNLAYEALDVAADLDARARKTGVHFGELEVSAFEPGATPADRIEIVTNKICGATKLEQIRYGPTILVVDLGRINMDTHHPSALLPVYFDDRMDAACVSGELWHVAQGLIGDMIYKPTEFEGKSNLDRRLNVEGILRGFPELLGVSFFLHRISGEKEIYSIWNLNPVTQGLQNPLTLEEHEIGELFHTFSDAVNDNHNQHSFEWVHRK